MIDISLVSLLVVNFLAIVILPRIFFRADGKLNLMWWITGAPYGVAPLGVLLQHFGYLPENLVFFAHPALMVISPIVSVFSVGLICYTLGTHRIPLALWHQENDAPRQIVTWGAYKRIRHPFYSSFLLALTAALIATPNVLTLLSLIYGFAILNMTASKEEKKLSSSEFGKDYQAYLKTTGRFFPKLTGS